MQRLAEHLQAIRSWLRIMALTTRHGGGDDISQRCRRCFPAYYQSPSFRPWSRHLIAWAAHENVRYQTLAMIGTTSCRTATCAGLASTVHRAACSTSCPLTGSALYDKLAARLQSFCRCSPCHLRNSRQRLGGLLCLDWMQGGVLHGAVVLRSRA